MKIKELEKKLGITRANIRFYEEKGLIAPQRKDNNYREYTQEDFEKLQWVVLLRKMDISVADIQKILDNEEQLKTVLKAKEEALKNKIDALQGAVTLCEIMQSENITLQNASPEKYLQLVQREEKAGRKFQDILGDISKEYKKDVLEYMFGEFNTLKEFLFLVLFICVGRGLIGYFFFGEKPLYAFFYPLLIGGIVSFFYWVVALVKLKSPKAAEIIQKIILGIAVTPLLLFVCMLLFVFFKWILSLFGLVTME